MLFNYINTGNVNNDQLKKTVLYDYFDRALVIMRGAVFK